MSYEKRNRSKGCIVGAAIGDSLAMPVEYISREDAEACFKLPITDFTRAPAGHPYRHLTPGQFTAHTQHLITLGDSLRELHQCDLHDLSKRFLSRSRRTQTAPDDSCFPEHTHIIARERLPGDDASVRRGLDSPTSCGSSVRVAPVGVFYYYDLNKARQYGRQSSTPTHPSTVAQEAAGFTAEAIAYLMQGGQPHAAVLNALRHVTDLNLKTKLAITTQLTNEHTPKQLRGVLGTSQAAIDTLPFAVASFLRAHSFEDAVVFAANGSVPGGTAAITAIAGALAGARYGYRSIPNKHLEGLEQKGYLAQLAEDLICSTIDLTQPNTLGVVAHTYEDASKYIGRATRIINAYLQQEGWAPAGADSGDTSTDWVYGKEGSYLGWGTVIQRDPLRATIRLPEWKYNFPLAFILKNTLSPHTTPGR